eukprot:scaffold8949_cov75-Cyclotella_meneghiniana.AAC.8
MIERCSQVKLEVTSCRLMCVGGDWTGGKVVIGHGIGVGLPLVWVVNLRMARGVQLFPRGNDSICSLSCKKYRRLVK